MSALHSSFLPFKIPNRLPSVNIQRRRPRSAGSQSSTISNSGRTLFSPAVARDWKLVQQAIAGDSHAQEKLFATHAARLYRTAFSVVRNKEDAEDAVQNSLCNAFINLPFFRGRSSFSTWLTRIVINSALMILRKNRNAREVSTEELNEAGKVWLNLRVPDVSPNPEQRYVARERRRILNEAICNLCPRSRTVVELNQLQELSLKETAGVLGISVAAAKARFFHARAALRESAALRALDKARRSRDSAASKPQRDSDA